MSKSTSRQSNTRSLLWAAALLAVTVALYLMTREANHRIDQRNGGEGQDSSAETDDPTDVGI